ncbi:hypothetical protein HC891_24405 [Candidatus Gracilibacteria bacterium]|nr:hypothetical protein [Candidatus Gracilibacteria bacterium]
MSHTLQISVPDTIYETLSKTAQQTGQPLEAIAITWLAVAAERVAHDPLDGVIGAFDSGGTDWADNHDHYLGQTERDERTGDTP